MVNHGYEKGVTEKLVGTLGGILRRNRPPTSEAEEEEMDSVLLLTGHEEEQSDGGPAHRRVGADGQLADSLVEQQKDGVVAQPGDKVAADRERERETKSDGHLRLANVSFIVRVCMLPAGRAGLKPQLDTEQRHSDVITHLDLLVVDGAEDWRETRTSINKLISESVYKSIDTQRR